MIIDECIFKEAENIKHFDVKIVPCCWDGRYSLCLVINDITARIENRNLELVDKYKNKLLASVTHDLKTPLNSICIFLDLVRGQLMEKPIQVSDILYQINLMRKSCDLLFFTINDILDYSKMQAQELRLDI